MGMMVSPYLHAAAPGGGGGTIALDAHTAAGVNVSGNPIGTQVFNHTVGSGSDRLLVVTVEMRGGNATSATHNGVAMTQVDTSSVSGSAGASMFYLVNPSSGTFSISIAHNAAGGARMVASATSLTGVHQTTPLNAFGKAGASSTGPMTTSVTSTVANCWIIDSCAMRTGASDTATMTAVTNRVERTNALTDANGLRGLSSTIGPAAAAGSHTTEWTKSFNHDWAIIAAAFAPA
jgi:hypothetical protein